MTDSPLCTFCAEESESLEHLLISCSYTRRFWLDFICWCKNIGIELEVMSDIHKLFGIWKRKGDFLLLDHYIIITKQNLCECQTKNTCPSVRIFTSKLKYGYQLELQIIKSNNKESSHSCKWIKFINSLHTSQEYP